jgi:hypothetical protein
MKKGLVVIAGILIVVIGIKIISNNKDNTNSKAEESTQITNIEISNFFELFPSEKIKYDFQNEDTKIKVEVVDINTQENTGENTEESKKIVTTKREEKQDNETVTIQMTYEITSEKIIESGKYIKDGQDVSTIYPVEIVKGSLTVGNEWKSVDGITTTKVTSSNKNTVTIESLREFDSHEENSKTVVKKTYVETRIFEKGKGIVAYKSEIR